MKKYIILLLIVLAVLLLIVGGYLLWKEWNKTPEEKALEKAGETAKKITESATSGVLPTIDPSNPLKDVPNINPVEKTNPFKNIYTNPFSQ